MLSSQVTIVLPFKAGFKIPGTEFWVCFVAESRLIFSTLIEPVVGHYLLKSPSIPSLNYNAASVIHQIFIHAFFFPPVIPHCLNSKIFIVTFGIWLGKYPPPSQFLMFLKFIQ